MGAKFIIQQGELGMMKIDLRVSIRIHTSRALPHRF